MRVAIIGSGPGGAVVASELVEHGFEVVVFEKGGVHPQSKYNPYSKEEMLNKYVGAGITAAFGNPKIKYAQGSCFGGGSEVNAGLYHRMPVDIINDWSVKYCIENFSSDSLDEHFIKTARAVNVTYFQGDFPALSLKLKDGADILNWQSIEVPRWFKYNENGGVRQSMSETLWAKVYNNPLFNLRANSSVKLIYENKLKNGWSLKTDSGTYESFDAIFMASGAIETPRLLRRNKLSNIAGNSMFMHPSIKIAAKFDETINLGEPIIGVHQVKHFSPRFSFGCSISSPEFIGLVLNENGCDISHEMNNWNKFGIYYAMSNVGRGSVKNIPFLDEPFVQYFLSDNDIDIIKESILKLAELLFAAGAIEIFPGIAGIGKVCSMLQLEGAISSIERRSLNLMTIHIMGGCPFGERSEITVADSWGRVHGYKGLLVADSSLMNSGLGVNPQGAVMALARRVVTKFTEEFQNV